MAIHQITDTDVAGRTLHLVDLENLVGDPEARGPRVRAALDAYLELARWTPGDHVIVASNPWLIGEVAFDLPVPCNVHAVHGEDGADTMLLAHAMPELVAKRYGRLVIGSGDGVFAARARAAINLGVGVLIIARPRCLSASLRNLGCAVLPFDDSLELPGPESARRDLAPAA